MSFIGGIPFITELLTGVGGIGGAVKVATGDFLCFFADFSLSGVDVSKRKHFIITQSENYKSETYFVYYSNVELKYSSEQH